jgi:hypothetical protein
MSDEQTSKPSLVNLQATVARLALVKLQAETLRAQLEADAVRCTVETAKANTEFAQAQADSAKFGYSRATRPSSLLGPLITYYDDIGSRWAVSYGAVGKQIIDILPDHIMETGVTAYGATPEKAMENFDRLWKGEDNATEQPDD